MKRTTTAIAGALIGAASLFAGFTTDEPSYINAPVDGDFDFIPLVTVGDRVPLAGGAPNSEYAMVGIPDAMGLYRDRATGERVLFLAHELTSGNTSKPIEGGDTYKGAFVSRYTLDTDASIAEGGMAHKALYLENVFFSPEPPKSTDGKAFTRFCSGSYAGPEHGMDRPIFLTNEESGSGNFDSAGSQVVAVIDGNMHTLPALGRVARETTAVMPRRDAYTTVLMSEDGGNSYIYMYVGTKNRRASDAITKNGLTGGDIYVLAGSGADAGKNESSFANGIIDSKWVKIADAANKSANSLNSAARSAGGFIFNRVEDLEFDPASPTRSMYVGVTGGSGSNRLGRLYRVHFNPAKPTLPGKLEVIYNADDIVKPGGDINAGQDFPVSIDNIAVTRTQIIVCEDRNSPATEVFTKYGRNGGVWTLDINNGFAAKYQGDFNFSYVEARDSRNFSLGQWEASGVIDASSLFGPGTFIINVQAHGTDRTNVPDGNGGYLTSSESNSRFVEDGQVILMRPRK